MVDEGAHRSDATGTEPSTATGAQRTEQREVQTDTAGGKYKTSAAAAFALVFGILALFAGLTGLLAPIAILLGIIGVILGIVGMKRAGRPLKTGKGVAISGLVLSIIGLLLGVVITAGAVTVLNNRTAVNRIEKQLNKAKTKLPSPAASPTSSP